MFIVIKRGKRIVLLIKKKPWCHSLKRININLLWSNCSDLVSVQAYCERSPLIALMMTQHATMQIIFHYLLVQTPLGGYAIYCTDW